MMTSETSGTHEMSLDQLDEVSGGFKMSAFGVTIHVSAAHCGIAISVKGVGGIAVSAGGLATVDSKGNVNNAPLPQ